MLLARGLRRLKAMTPPRHPSGRFSEDGLLILPDQFDSPYFRSIYALSGSLRPNAVWLCRLSKRSDLMMTIAPDPKVALDRRRGFPQRRRLFLATSDFDANRGMPGQPWARGHWMASIEEAQTALDRHCNEAG